MSAFSVCTVAADGLNICNDVVEVLFDMESVY